MPKQKGSTLKRMANLGHGARKKARYDLDQDDAKENNAPATVVSGSCATSHLNNLSTGTVLCQPEAPHLSNLNLDHDTPNCGLAIIAESLFGLSAHEDLRQEEEHLIWGTYQKFFVMPVLSKDAEPQKLAASDCTKVADHPVSEAGDLGSPLRGWVSAKGDEPEQLLESMQVYEFIQESGLIGEDSAQENDSDDETETEMEMDKEMETDDSDDSAAGGRSTDYDDVALEDEMMG
ncbi:hypothetical protein BDN67DRAFT_1016408 [Paxillus ammoniavirescens]|nr:hypothetical protein BDN67DRAFT_1016408 [Paxillus ammoniavirescens]